MDSRLGRGAERSPGAWAFCLWLSLRAAGVKISLALVALAGAGGVAVAIGGRGRPWQDAVPAVASAALAWGAGVMVAFAAAMRALQRDRDAGVLALLRARGVGPTAYTLARAGGLVVILMVALGGAVLAVGVAATATSGSHLRAARHGLGAVAYALAFAATLGPLTMATLGGRSRAAGYVALLAALAAPELLAPWTAALLPPGSRELTSIAAALDAVRRAVVGAAPVAPALRGLAGLSVVVALSLWSIRVRAGRLAGMEDASEASR